MKQKKNLKKPITKYQKQKNVSTSIQLTILKQFLNFKACKSGEIDAIGIEVAQQIKLSGCLTKGHFTAKNANGVNLSKFSCFKF